MNGILGMRDPKKPADLLGAILREAGATPARARIRRAVAAALDEAADHVSVRSFRGGKLVLEVDSAPLFAELRSFGQESLRKRINEALDGGGVAQITFRMGGAGHA